MTGTALASSRRFWNLVVCGWNRIAPLPPVFCFGFLELRQVSWRSEGHPAPPKPLDTLDFLLEGFSTWLLRLCHSSGWAARIMRNKKRLAAEMALGLIEMASVQHKERSGDEITLRLLEIGQRAGTMSLTIVCTTLFMTVQCPPAMNCEGKSFVMTSGKPLRFPLKATLKMPAN